MRLKSSDIINQLKRGREMVSARQIRREFAMPGGVTLELACAPNGEYQRLLSAARKEVEAELAGKLDDGEKSPSLARREASRAEVKKALASPDVVSTLAAARVLAELVTAVYDPAISTRDDPAVKLGFLVEMGLPLPPDEYTPEMRDYEVCVTPELIAHLVHSPAVQNFSFGKIFDLQRFYENGRAEAVKKPVTRPAGGSPVESPARSAGNESSANSGAATFTIPSESLNQSSPDGRNGS